MAAAHFTQAGGAELRLLDGSVCDVRCALHTMTHADALLAGYSSFSMLAATLSHDSQLVAYTPAEQPRWQAHYTLNRQQTNHSYTESPSAFAAQLRARCDAR
jgi:hypothetical protein